MMFKDKSYYDNSRINQICKKDVKLRIEITVMKQVLVEVQLVVYVL